MPGKGRATSYTDYYKNNNETPNGTSDDEEERQKTYGKMPMMKGIKSKSKMMDMNKEDGKKAAIKRRLMRRKAGS